jgi:hypothetical protein
MIKRLSDSKLMSRSKNPLFNTDHVFSLEHPGYLRNMVEGGGGSLTKIILDVPS